MRSAPVHRGSAGSARQRNPRCGNIAHPIRHTAANPQRQASHPAQFPARALQRTPPRWMSRGLRWAPAPAPGSHPPGTPIFGCRWRTAAAVLVLPQPGARVRCRAGRARRHEEALIRNHPTGRDRARAQYAPGERPGCDHQSESGRSQQCGCESANGRERPSVKGGASARVLHSREAMVLAPRPRTPEMFSIRSPLSY